ncbi:hypothetical protein [uncultured Kordia sp.]|uniref:hypothetical protein n=1 Tax=uncultured Kordia sp. TaxID=507699 RepID=UPI00260B590E|nr:hypothetical protein [uncultured Kordia sp.]
MSFISKFFNKEKVQCPRCLGKGHVDLDDIKRLNKELKWLPGSCAYCNGKGKVKPELISKIAVDTTYLTTDLSTEERKKLIAHDELAVLKAAYHDIHTDSFIEEITFLHFQGNLDSNTIAAFYQLNQKALNAEDKAKLIDYINEVIAHKK